MYYAPAPIGSLPRRGRGDPGSRESHSPRGQAGCLRAGAARSDLPVFGLREYSSAPVVHSPPIIGWCPVPSFSFFVIFRQVCPPESDTCRQAISIIGNDGPVISGREPGALLEHCTRLPDGRGLKLTFSIDLVSLQLT